MNEWGIKPWSLFFDIETAGLASVTDTIVDLPEKDRTVYFLIYVMPPEMDLNRNSMAYSILK